MASRILLNLLIAYYMTFCQDFSRLIPAELKPCRLHLFTAVNFIAKPSLKSYNIANSKIKQIESYCHPCESRDPETKQ